MIYLVLSGFCALLIGFVVLFFSSYQTKRISFYGIVGFLFFSLIVGGVFVRIIQLAFNWELPLITLLIFGVVGSVIGVYAGKPKGQKILNNPESNRVAALIILIVWAIISFLIYRNPQLQEKYNQCMRTRYDQYRSVGCSFNSIF